MTAVGTVQLRHLGGQCDRSTLPAMRTSERVPQCTRATWAGTQIKIKIKIAGPTGIFQTHSSLRKVSRNRSQTRTKRGAARTRMIAARWAEKLRHGKETLGFVERGLVRPAEQTLGPWRTRPPEHCRSGCNRHRRTSGEVQMYLPRPSTA